MIEETVIAFLGQTLSVYAETPQNPPADGIYCVVEKTGGGEDTPGIREATIAIQCCAPTLYEAAQLCEDVVDLMRELTQLPGVARCRLNSSYNFTDDRRHQYRYQCVYAIVYY